MELTRQSRTPAPSFQLSKSIIKQVIPLAFLYAVETAFFALASKDADFKAWRLVPISGVVLFTSSLLLLVGTCSFPSHIWFLLGHLLHFLELAIGSIAASKMPPVVIDKPRTVMSPIILPLVALPFFASMVFVVSSLFFHNTHAREKDIITKITQSTLLFPWNFYRNSVNRQGDNALPVGLGQAPRFEEQDLDQSHITRNRVVPATAVPPGTYASSGSSPAEEPQSQQTQMPSTQAPGSSQPLSLFMVTRVLPLAVVHAAEIVLFGVISESLTAGIGDNADAWRSVAISGTVSFAGSIIVLIFFIACPDNIWFSLGHAIHFAELVFGCCVVSGKMPPLDRSLISYEIVLLVALSVFASATCVVSGAFYSDVLENEQAFTIKRITQSAFPFRNQELEDLELGRIGDEEPGGKFFLRDCVSKSSLTWEQVPLDPEEEPLLLEFSEKAPPDSGLT